MGNDDRLKWRCRRGLLELDLILQGFLERRFARLDAAEKALFGELLDTPDPIRVCTAWCGSCGLDSGAAGKIRGMSGSDARRACALIV
jgi:hypothetical protein